MNIGLIIARQRDMAKVVLSVLAFIGLTVFVAPAILEHVEEAKKSQAEAEVKAIREQMLRFASDVGHFPLYKDGTKNTGEPDIELLWGPGNNPGDTTAKWLATTKVGELEDHLVRNTPGSAPYPTGGHYFKWRGPYSGKVTEDPWGNRYLVNIKNAAPADPATKVVWVLSAGPNGKIETEPNASANSVSTPGGDDIAVRIK